MSQATRTPTHPVNELFLNRWSPRAYSGEAVPQDTLFTILEAARWAPSAFNIQPWRFLYARRDTAAWDTFLDLLIPFNQSWAKNAGALIIVLSKIVSTAPGTQEPKPNPSHTLDTGAAWANLALQAQLLGWDAHGMTGLDKDAARQALNVPEDYAVEMAIAIGKRTDPSVLPEGLREREAPSDRLPLESLIAEGGFAGNLA